MTQTYKSFRDFLADVDARTERVTGTVRGVIIDTITRQDLGRWEYTSTGGAVRVRWS